MAPDVVGKQLEALKEMVPKVSRAGALVVLMDAIFTNQRRQMAKLAEEKRLPAVYGHGEHAAAGGLTTYSANLFDLERRAATFVDKILKGAKPGALPWSNPHGKPFPGNTEDSRWPQSACVT